MVSLAALWLPILLSAVFIFVASSIIHMAMPYHRSDFSKLPGEEDVMEGLRAAKIPPGDYVMPQASGNKEMNSPEYKEKLEQGPIAFMTVLPNGQLGMGASLVQWFVYCIVVGACAAYVAGRALGPGSDYLEVFRFAGCAAFLSYTMALWQMSIWYKRKWSTTIKFVFDGLIYSLITAGTFGWLWPAA